MFFSQYICFECLWLFRLSLLIRAIVLVHITDLERPKAGKPLEGVRMLPRAGGQIWAHAGGRIGQAHSLKVKVGAL
ncbi:hypothetical protein BDA96_03G407300 [Sorghum bicolor]|uniref:Uncharacterized protein n=1 Tax=Sorghum bicolor TaxID=4558 RepID=A0A921UQ75_SORBI|nr:hypothetical protein BDA96_03G407300 [Sorghum bicolor]